MRLYSYVVARDYGFAPNPFGGYCTLATCKPAIRRGAQVGDVVIGVTPRARGNRLTFAMRVDEALGFDEYWSDQRFATKKPCLTGSLKQAFGDNIYHRNEDGSWIQADSHHSFANGVPNTANIERDTSADRVLISENFRYFGDSAIEVPTAVRRSGAVDMCDPGRGHRVNFPDTLVARFVAWLSAETSPGVWGDPAAWRR